MAQDMRVYEHVGVWVCGNVWGVCVCICVWGVGGACVWVSVFIRVPVCAEVWLRVMAVPE